jgi:hypothetical protein
MAKLIKDEFTIDEFTVVSAAFTEDDLKKGWENFWGQLGLTDAEVQEVLDATALKTLSTWFDEMTYQGFSIATLFEAVKKILDAYIAEAGGDRKQGLKNFMSDLQYLLTVNLIRGTKIASIEKKSSVAFVKTWKIVSVKWNIVDTGKPNSTLAPSDITLARLAALFPQLCIRIRFTGLKEKKMPTIAVDAVPKGLPLELCYAGGAALIPNVKAFDPLFEKWLKWNKAFDGVIKSKSVKKDGTTALSSDSELRSYASLSRGSPIMSLPQKLKYLKMFTSISDVKVMCDLTP